MDDQQTDAQNQTSDRPQTETATSGGSNAQDADVLEVRTKALQALIPLIDSLKGTPEYKFDVIMNAIQVSSDTSLLKKALETAMQMEDPSLKADALVDILNETQYQENVEAQ